MEAVEVGVGDPQRAARPAVDRHRLEVEGGGLDLLADAAAGAPAIAARVGRLALGRDPARFDQCVRCLARAHLLGELGLADRPPGIRAEGGQRPRELGAERGAVLLGRERAADETEALELRLELGAPLAAAAVPALEVSEHRGGARERMVRGIGERHRGRVAGAGEERGAIEPPGLALGRRPARAVGEFLGEEVADRVAQGRPDPGGVGVGGQIFEVGDRDPAELLALGEDLGELPACRGGDLLAGPELQVELLVARHPLAAADLPGVGALVLGERAGEVEADRGVGARSRGPGRGGQRLDRRLVAAERDAQLGAAHERARPLLVGAGRAGPFEQRLDPVGRLGELLLGDERVDRLPVGSRRGAGAAHRAGARAGERGDAERAGGGEAGEESAAEAGRAHGNLRSITGWRFPGPS